MKILFFTDSHEDYVADSLLHGLKKTFGPQVVDYPRKDILYHGETTMLPSGVRGGGFTLYTGLLQEDSANRYDIVRRLQTESFDIVVFGNIHRQDHYFKKFRPYLHRHNTLVVDGEDGIAPVWQTDASLSILKKYRYFKREQADTQSRIFRSAPNFLPISIGFPAEKITPRPPKSKEFGAHVVDPEVAACLQARTDSVFASEVEYYKDLQASRFGVTMKRGGWDCLRHYEIAGNGCVPCFRRLEQKPSRCAPHGLTDQNCLPYTDVQDLMKKTRSLQPGQYEALQAASQEWIQANTTTKSVERVLSEFFKDR